jgi:hypothetical protein
MLASRNEIRMAALAASGEAIRARGAWQRRLRSTARDVGAIVVACLAPVVCASYLPHAATDLVGGFALTLLFFLLVPPVDRLRTIAVVGHWLCTRLGLDAPSMARARRSQTATSRARSAHEAHAVFRVVLSAVLMWHLTALRLAALGAVAATSQPRLAASLVAGFAALSAA